MRLNQKGFGVVEGLLTIVAIAMISGVGFFVYHSQNDTKQSLSNASAAADSDPVVEKQNSISKTDPNYIVISEWNIAVRVGSTSYSKNITYTIDKDTSGKDVVAYLNIKNDVSPTCRTLGVMILKQDTQSKEADDFTKVGDSYYAISNQAPVAQCDKESDQQAVLKAQSISKPVAEAMSKGDFEIKPLK